MRQVETDQIEISTAVPKSDARFNTPNVKLPASSDSKVLSEAGKKSEEAISAAVVSHM